MVKIKKRKVPVRNGGNAAAVAAKQAIRQENVARILEAAEAVFATKGF